MMEFNFLAGLVAGFVGTLAMSVLMRAGSAMGMTSMPPMSLIQGAMMTDDPERAKRIGMVTHVLVMGTVVFGTVYAAVFSAVGSASWLAGLVVGLVHGIVAGAVGMPMMGSMHPRMQGAAAFTGGTAWTAEGGALRIEEPGLFGRNYGPMTPVGLVMGHLVYGLVVALVYSALV